MKKFWKVLGLAALAAGLTPYKVEKNEETGENSYQALLWRITSSQSESGDRNIGINLGEGTLTSKLADAMEKKDEAHLFTDELSVEYSASDVEAAAEEAASAGEEIAKAGEAIAEAGEAVAEAGAEIAEAGEAAAESVEEPKAE